MSSKEESKLNEAVDVKLTVTCDDCGKPIASKAKTNVTRFLFAQSRCTCSRQDANRQSASRQDARLQNARLQNARLQNAAPLPSVVQEKVEDNSRAQNILGDRYEVLGTLGRGGMGAVYRVRDVQLDRIFAVKILNENLVEDKASVQRFEHEAQAAQQLNHPGLVSVYSYGLGSGDTPYLVMDYVDGENLGDLLFEAGSLDVPRAVDMFHQIAEAAAYAHSQGVVHRDIKPSNIIISSRENDVDVVKLVDFGIAKVLPSNATATKNLTQTGDIFGSPLYMSPEQCMGNPIDARSDVYALGCVMYEALSGVQPFAAENPVKIILKHIHEEPASLAPYSVPQSLETIILRCLEKDPSDRYQSMDELASDLAFFRDGKPVPERKARKSEQKPGSERGLKRHGHFSFRGRPTAAIILGGIGGGIGLIAAICAIVAVSIGFIPPARDAITGKSDAYTDAMSFDSKSLEYFNRGSYKQALPLLQFDIETFRDRLKHSTTQDLRTEGFLADSLNHAGKCCLALKEYDKAETYYKEALSMYTRFGNYKGGLMDEALRDYASTLIGLNRPDEAATMKKIESEWNEFYSSHPNFTMDQYWKMTAEMRERYGNLFAVSPR